MSRLRQAFLWLAFCLAGSTMVFPLAAENSTNVFAPSKSFSSPTKLPPMPQSQSPVDFFRQLLAMSPDEREDFLASRPVAVRERILAKVSEYQALDPDERELRLRATELRWYLTPLLLSAATNHAAQLAQVPEDLRDLVKSRLVEWDILPPPVQREFLENERTLHYFAHVDPTNNPGDPAAEKSRQIAEQFDCFFELTPAEKEKTLGTLSEAEREQMEKTLRSFDQLPPSQRFECIRAFTKFAAMNPQDRADFLKNAERWSQMPPKDRQAWRDLVTHVPEWPPLPQSFIMPPMPPMPTIEKFHSAIATNLN
jgi:Protein of unknown function (DUF3106)